MKTSIKNKAEKMTSLFLYAILAVVCGMTLYSCEEDPCADDDPETFCPYDTTATLIVDTTIIDTTIAGCTTVEGLYLEHIYSKEDVSVEKDIVYQESGSNTYDLYQVEVNTDPARPIVLLSPGGGWNSYTKQEAIGGMAYDLAQRGYVVALVRYSITTGDPDIGIWLRSVQDHKTAIRYFKTHAAEMRLDPDKVIIGGWSTGSILALTNGYFQESEVADIAQESFREIVEDGIATYGFEGDDYLDQNTDVKAVLAMYGWLFERTSIDANEPALMMINHADVFLSDSTKAIGQFESDGFINYGTDELFERAKEVGYSVGENLVYIRETDNPGGNFHPNVWSLTDENYDAIASFFNENIQ